MVKVSHTASGIRWQVAMRKATLAYQAGVRAVRTGNRTYAVPSATSDATYTVTVGNLTRMDVSCSCPCGSHPEAGTHCYHAALAWSAELGRVSNVERTVRRLSVR